MGTKEKLVERFKRQPKDFTFNELTRLFQILGFEMSQKGKTSGSRIEFVNNEKELSYGAHKPRPDSSIKSYVMKQVLEFLTSNKII
ncbi:MAG: type II toxin-antitoxin system HicA family toxin [Bacteroidia bacterium]|nr:type II toxin-antitoxin system HicA family toxin [Bacteroidia bacterium]